MIVKMAASTNGCVILKLSHENKKYDVNLTANSSSLTLKDLSEQVELLTGVLEHRQRLIFNGKSLNEKSATLEALGIRNGSKLMLIGRKFNEQDEGHLKVMKSVEGKVNDTRSKLGEIESEVKDIKNGHLPSELHKEAFGKLSRRVLGCIEAFQKQLEQLDALSLSESSTEVQTRRKTIVQQIQEFLQKADNLHESIETIRTAQ